MLWDGASDFTRVLLTAPLAYVALVAVLRISGKRMLSKMSAFDLVVTIAMGSTLSTTIVSKDVSLSEGLAGLGMLIGLQYLAAWTAARSEKVRRILKSEPRLLLFDGKFLHDALRAENVPEETVRAGIRQRGINQVEDVGAVVIEADGSLSILARPDAAHRSALRGVKDMPDDANTDPSRARAAD